MLKKSPYHSRIEPLCLSYDWRRWAGYVVASKYELTHEREYAAIRNAAALIDVSPLYKYLVAGPDAGRFLDRVLTRHASRCVVGQVMYTTWCDEHGQMLEDGTVSRLSEDSYRVTAAEPNLRWFQNNAGRLNVTITDVSDETAALAVQGPRSREVLLRVAGEQLAGLRYFHWQPAVIAGRPATISRTGYTGDLGYEIWSPAADAEAIWDALVEAGGDYGLLPAGMLALDLVRLEAGLILVDVDYTPANKAIIEAQKSSPFEVGLGWTVDLQKPGYFIGRSALEAEKRRRSEWALAGLVIEWESLEEAYERVSLPPQVPHTTWRQSTPLYDSRGREAGYATSGGFSPMLKRYLALATLRSAYSAPGTRLEMEITVEHMRRRARATVVKTPFFDPPRKKSVPTATVERTK